MATITQTSPLTFTSPANQTSTTQITTAGNTGTVTFTTTSTAISGITCSSSGLVSVMAPFPAVGSYTISGTMTDGTNTGTWTLSISVIVMVSVTISYHGTTSGTLADHVTVGSGFARVRVLNRSTQELYFAINAVPGPQAPNSYVVPGVIGAYTDLPNFDIPAGSTIQIISASPGAYSIMAFVV